MENKNNVALFSLVFLVVGIFLGWLIWGSDNDQSKMMWKNQGVHMMPDGSMMGNNNMDMQAMMDQMNAGLQGKTGDTFDQEFLFEMIVHHQGAIDMARLALTNAKHQEIKDLAADIITAQTKEIEEMKQWQKTWYNK